ncbi:MAG: hypothetical protein IPP88_23195 [Betaproteobacteria bacterium]|nr:hypothetical protein [Betaproteobacteria bacterium]
MAASCRVSLEDQVAEVPVVFETNLSIVSALSSLSNLSGLSNQTFNTFIVMRSTDFITTVTFNAASGQAKSRYATRERQLFAVPPKRYSNTKTGAAFEAFLP